MKTKQALALVIIVLLGVIFINADLKPQQKKSHEYISIYYASPRITITHGIDKYESYKIDKKKVNGVYDTREVFKLIEKYEKDGYKIIESNAYNTGGDYANIRTYYLLQK